MYFAVRKIQCARNAYKIYCYWNACKSGYLACKNAYVCVFMTFCMCAPECNECVSIATPALICAYTCRVLYVCVCVYGICDYLLMSNVIHWPIGKTIINWPRSFSALNQHIFIPLSWTKYLTDVQLTTGRHFNVLIFKAVHSSDHCW